MGGVLASQNAEIVSLFYLRFGRSGVRSKDQNYKEEMFRTPAYNHRLPKKPPTG